MIDYSDYKSRGFKYMTTAILHDLLLDDIAFYDSIDSEGMEYLEARNRYCEFVELIREDALKRS